ncbi:MAG: dihydroorotase family protein [Candidatus Hodarchaeota archaeon]
MSVDLVLKDGLVILEGKEVVRSISIDSGIIHGIHEAGNEPSASKVIGCSGLYVLPGSIDMHVHMRDLGQVDKEDYATGTMAAAAGGVTTVADMPNSDPPTFSLPDLEHKIAVAQEKRLVNVGFYTGVPTDVADFDSSVIPQILGIKIYPHSPLAKKVKYTRARVIECMQLSVEHRVPLLIHPNAAPRRIAKSKDDFFFLHSCENEVKSLNQFLAAKAQVGGKLHVCHVSCGTTARLIVENRAEETLTAEVSPHHLFLHGDEFTHETGEAKMTPPLRSPFDNKSLQQALCGTCGIDVVASDHAPHSAEDKLLPFMDAPGGIPGLETTVPLMLTEVFEGRLSWVDYLRCCCSGPARILGLDAKGVLAEGFDADIVIVSKEEWTIKGGNFYSKAKLTPFEGRRVLAKPRITIVEGDVVYEDGDFPIEGGVAGRVPVRRLMPRRKA